MSSNRLLKIVASALVLTMVIQDLSWADPNINIAGRKKLLKIPSAIGTVEEVSLRAQRSDLTGEIASATASPRNDHGKTIFLIQDAHTNESAQRNIAKILNALIEKENIRTVFLEAGTGDDSLSDLRPLAAAQKRKDVSDRFLRKGWIQGPDHLDLNSEKTFKLWGVEDRSLYFRGIGLYGTIRKDREHANAFLDKIQRALGTLKPKLFHPALSKFDDKRAAYLSSSGGKGELSLTEYFKALSEAAHDKNISLLAYPNFLMLEEVQEKESRIDFKKAGLEQQKVFAELSAEDKAEFLDSLQGKDRLDRAGMDNARKLCDVYAVLKERSSAGDHPELFKYIDYLGSVQKIGHEALLAELTQIEVQIYEALTSTIDERTLLQISRAEEILRRLVNLQATSADIRGLREDPAAFDAVKIGGYLNRLFMELEGHYEDVIFLDEKYEAVFKNALEFYGLTERRDEVFVKNIAEELDRRKETKAAFVVGGFHIEHLKKLLREKNISYVSILPRVLQETNTRKYEALLLSQVLPVQTSEPPMPIKMPAKLWGVLPAGELAVQGIPVRSMLKIELGSPSQGARLSEEKTKEQSVRSLIVNGGIIAALVAVFLGGVWLTRWKPVNLDEVRKKPFDQTEQPSLSNEYEVIFQSAQQYELTGRALDARRAYFAGFLMKGAELDFPGIAQETKDPATALRQMADYLDAVIPNNPTALGLPNIVRDARTVSDLLKQAADLPTPPDPRGPFVEDIKTTLKDITRAVLRTIPSGSRSVANTAERAVIGARLAQVNAEQERAKALIDTAKDTHDAVVVLNVCLMNQHRSPTMHVILQDVLEREGAGLGGKVTIRSGGMWWPDILSMQSKYAAEDESALPKVEVPDGFIQAADEAGIDEDVIRSIRPSGVTADQVDKATVIVASEEWIRKLLLKHFPAAAGKTFLFTELAPGVFDTEAVPDPGQGQISYRELFAGIRRGFEGFLLPWLQRRAVNAFPESVSLSDASIDRTSSIALELAQYVHGGNFDALVFSGSSRMTTYGPFSAAWTSLYPGKDLPKIVFLDRRDNTTLYKNKFTTPDRKRRVFLKNGLDLPGNANILAVEDISHSGTKVIDMTNAYHEAGYRNIRWAHFAAKSDSSIFSDPRSRSFVGSEDPVYFGEFTFFAIGASEGADGVKEAVERVKAEIAGSSLLRGSRLASGSASGSIAQQLKRFGSDMGVLIKSIQLHKDLSTHNRQRVSSLLDELLQLSRSDAVRRMPSDLREELRDIHGDTRGILNYQMKDLGSHAAQLLGSAKRRLESVVSSDDFRLYEETFQKETDLGAAQELVKIEEVLARIGTDLGALKRGDLDTRRTAVESLLRNVRDGKDRVEKFQDPSEYGHLDFVHRGLRRGFRRLEHFGAVFFSPRAEQSRLIRQMPLVYKKLNAAHKRASRHLLVRNTVLHEKPAKGDRWTVPALAKKLRKDERTVRYDLKYLGLSGTTGANVWKLEQWVEARRDWLQNKLLNEDPPQPEGWTTADLAVQLAKEKTFPSTYGNQKRAQKAVYQDLEARDLLRSERLQIVEQKSRVSEQEVAARRELVKRTLLDEDPPQGKKWTVPALAVRLGLSRITVYQDLKRQALLGSKRLDYKAITGTSDADLEIRRSWLERTVKQWPVGEKPDTAVLARAMMKQFPDRFGDDFRGTQVVVRKDLMTLGLFDESKVSVGKRSSDGSRLAKTQPLDITVDGQKKEVVNKLGTALGQVLHDLGIKPENVENMIIFSLRERGKVLLKIDQTNIQTFLSVPISSSQERIEIQTLAGSRLAQIEWQRKLPASKGKFYRPLNEHRHWEFFKDFDFPKYLMGSPFGSHGAFERWEIGSLDGHLRWSVDFPNTQDGPSRVAAQWWTEEDSMQDMELFSLSHWAAKGIPFDVSRAVVAALPMRIDSKTFKMYLLVQDEAYPYFEEDLGEKIRHDGFPSWEVIPVSQGLEITEEIEREVVHTPFSISNVLLGGTNADPSRAFPSSLREYLDQKNYEVLEILHGGSATDVLLIRERTTGKKFVLKYSEWEGVGGNGVPWLLAQARYMKETSEKLGTDVFPQIFDIHSFEDGAALYVMEYFDGSQSVADRLMNERSSGQGVLNEIGQLINFTAKELYEREPIEIRPALDMKRLHLNRMRDRLALVGERKGEVFHWLMRNRPVFFGKGASYRDFAEFYRDLMSKPTTRINGRIYPSLASLIQTLEERWPEVEKALGPGHYASYVHGDFSLRNALRSPDGKYHFIDTRGMGIHESTPDRISIEYEVGKLVHSLLSDFLQRDAFEVSAEGDGASIDIHASFKDGMPGAQGYMQAYRRIDDYLMHQETLRKLLGPEAKAWDRQIRLAEAAHYISNIIHRVNEDPTGKHALMYYVFSVATLTDFLSDLGLIESPARTSDLLSPVESSAETGSRLSESAILPVVDANGQSLGRTIQASERFYLELGEYVHSAAVLFLRKKDGIIQVFTQRRSADVSGQPDFWDATAAGRRDDGETIEQTAIRELGEETQKRFNLRTTDLEPLSDINTVLRVAKGPVNTRLSFFIRWVTPEEEKISEDMERTWEATPEVQGWRWRSLESLAEEQRADQQRNGLENKFTHAMRLSINELNRKMAGPAIVVQLGGSHIRAGWAREISNRVNPLAGEVMTPDKQAGPEALLSAIVRRIESARVDSGIPAVDIRDVLVASPGDINEQGFVRLANNLALTGVDLKKELERRLKMSGFDSVQVTVINDLISDVYGEWPVVPGEGELYLNVGTGISAARVRDAAPQSLRLHTFSVNGVLLEELYQRKRDEVKAGLAPMSELANLLKEPLQTIVREHSIRSIHVGGGVSETDTRFAEELQIVLPGIEIVRSELNGEQRGLLGGLKYLRQFAGSRLAGVSMRDAVDQLHSLVSQWKDSEHLLLDPLDGEPYPMQIVFDRYGLPIQIRGTWELPEKLQNFWVSFDFLYHIQTGFLQPDGGLLYSNDLKTRVLIQLYNQSYVKTADPNGPRSLENSTGRADRVVELSGEGETKYLFFSAQKSTHEFDQNGRSLIQTQVYQSDGQDFSAKLILIDNQFVSFDDRSFSEAVDRFVSKSLQRYSSAGSRLAEMRITVGDLLAARSMGILVSKGQGVRLEDIHEILIGPRGMYYDVRRASDLYRLTNGLSPETPLTVFINENAFAVDISYYKDHFLAILGARRHIRTLFLRYSLARHEQAALRTYLTDASLRDYARKILLRERTEQEAEGILSEAAQMSRSDDAPRRSVENSRIPELRQRIIALENKLETLKRRKAGSRSVNEAYRDIRDLKAEIRQERREQKGARLAAAEAGQSDVKRLRTELAGLIHRTNSEVDKLERLNKTLKSDRPQHSERLIWQIKRHGRLIDDLQERVEGIRGRLRTLGEDVVVDRGSRLAEKNRPETVSWLPQFKLMLVGLASILLLSTAQAMPLEVEPGAKAAVVSVQRQGQEVVAGNVPGLGEVRISRLDRSLPKAQGGGTSLSEIRMQNDSTNAQVHADLEAAGILSGRPVIVELGAQIFNGRSLEDFRGWFIKEVRAAKERDPNAYFVWQGAGNPDKNVLLSDVPADLKNAARVKVFRPGVSLGARLGARSVPTEIDEQSAPAFQALLETFIASGRIDTRNIPDGYVNAYSTLAGSRLSTQTLSDILEDRADLATQKQYSLKALLQNVGEYLRYANLRLRMLVQSA